jgi:16S rRNA (guanine966-N2)-methyltransferase
VSRIIAGDAGSIRLAGAPSGTRPTSDRVKESLFGSLEAMDCLDGSAVLDLFCGTAALGLEALSRGAGSLVGVEKHRPALQVALKNAAAVGTALSAAGRRPPMEFKLADSFGYLAGTEKEFDLILADPPYSLETSEVERLVGLAAKIIRPQGVIAIEQSSKVGAIEAPEGLELVARRDYGDTCVFVFIASAR